MQEAGHSQEIETTDEEGRKAGGGFGENGENCDFTIPRKVAESEWRISWNIEDAHDAVSLSLEQVQKGQASQFSLGHTEVYLF
jgi:hypothetical protein